MNNYQPPTLEAVPNILASAVAQIEFARGYVREFLDATPRDRWFEMPDGLPTHVAWQVGHLTVSQYGLLMFRLRGRSPDDLELIPGPFRKAYSRGTVPKADASSQPSADELSDRLDRVHELSLEVLKNVDPGVLLEPVEMPFAGYPVKLGAVVFCPLHEQIHAGQIGLLRRAMGLEPIR